LSANDCGAYESCFAAAKARGIRLGRNATDRLAPAYRQRQWRSTADCACPIPIGKAPVCRRPNALQLTLRGSHSGPAADGMPRLHSMIDRADADVADVIGLPARAPRRRMLWPNAPISSSFHVLLPQFFGVTIALGVGPAFAYCFLLRQLAAFSRRHLPAIERREAEALTRQAYRQAEPN